MKKNMEQKDFWIVGKHAVCEAIKNKKRTTADIAILEQNSDSIKAITSSKFKIVNKRFFNKICENQHYQHQGYAVKIKPFKKLNLKENIKNIKDILILNDINDQRNIGSILRNCLAFNIRNIIIPNKFYKANSMGLYITAAGSMEKINIYDVTNISNSIRLLKENDFWIVGFDQESNDTIEKFSFNKKNALILGSEGFGIKQLVKSQCDHILKIDISNELESLNVSNASAIILYELAKKNRPN
jgi:23S rRNA (guanosine2251-2'-O)-methyltransferase